MLHVLVYLPTFGWFMGEMLVNIPYMEHMGLYIYIYKNIMVKKILRPHYIDDGQYW